MTTYSDNFTRADGALGTDYDTPSGYSTLNVFSNGVRASALTPTLCMNNVKTSVADFSDNHSAQVTVLNPSSTAYVGPCVRVSGSTGYLIRSDTNDISGRRIYRFNDTTLTQIGVVNIPTTNNDVLKLEAEGTTIRAYKNGALVDTVTDATYTTGQPGLWAERQNASVVMDDFLAEDLTTSRIGTPTILTRFGNTPTILSSGGASPCIIQ